MLRSWYRSPEEIPVCDHLSGTTDRNRRCRDLTSEQASQLLDSSPTRTTLIRAASEKRLQPGLRAAEDQRVHVVGAFIGVDGLQVRGVAHDVVLDLDAVAAVHVARHAGDIERLAAVVALDNGDHLGRNSALV